MLGRADIDALVGEKNIEMMKDNHSNHARFAESFLCHPHSKVLVHTVEWVLRCYRSRGFHPNYWVAQLNAWVETLKKNLSPKSFEAIYPLYHWFIVNIPIFADLSDRQIRDGEDKKTSASAGFKNAVPLFVKGQRDFFNNRTEKGTILEEEKGKRADSSA
jgi:hypothetical protein